MRTSLKTTLLLLLWLTGLALPAGAQGTPNILWQAAASASTITSLAVSPDGRLAASPGTNGVQIWQIADGSRVQSLVISSWINQLAFSPDGKYLASEDGNGMVKLWRTNDWSLAYTITNVEQGPSLAFSPDSSMLAIGKSQIIELRNVANGNLIRSWQATSSSPPAGVSVLALAFAPDGTKLASGVSFRSADITLKVWSVATGQLFWSVPTAQTNYGVGMIVFSPDGSSLATGSQYLYSGPMQLWSAADGSLLHTFPENAYCAAFSPDGLMLMSVGTNIVFRQVANGALIQNYADGGAGYAKVCVFTPDGHVFLRVNAGGTIFAAQVPLWITPVAQVDGNLVLNWTGGTGSCRLQERTNFTDAWQTIGDVLTNQTVAIPIQYSNAFYRLIEL
jgi:WD40 repeat protein